MGTDSNTPNERNEAREDFALNLRRLRVAKGFRTARSLARALGIDENRYTRYERAEVEPDLGLIRRMCETLGLSPNELLGHDATAATADVAQSFADVSETDRPAAGDSPGNGIWAASQTEAAAWKLSCLVARLRIEEQPIDRNAGNPAKPLVFLQAATMLFQDLSRRPIETIGEIVRDPVVVGADAAATSNINELAMQLAGGMMRPD